MQQHQQEGAGTCARDRLPRLLSLLPAPSLGAKRAQPVGQQGGGWLVSLWQWEGAKEAGQGFLCALSWLARLRPGPGEGEEEAHLFLEQGHSLPQLLLLLLQLEVLRLDSQPVLLLRPVFGFVDFCLQKAPSAALLPARPLFRSWERVSLWLILLVVPPLSSGILPAGPAWLEQC